MYPVMMIMGREKCRSYLFVHVCVCTSKCIDKKKRKTGGVTRCHQQQQNEITKRNRKTHAFPCTCVSVFVYVYFPFFPHQKMPWYFFLVGLLCLFPIM